MVRMIQKENEVSPLARIRENELLKGYCERLYMINPYLTMGVLFEELFGERVLRIHPYVPSHINRIVGGLGGYFKSQDLIEQHTLYNFYTAFQGQEVQEDIKQKMLIDNGNAYKITKYNEIPIPQYYRYCPLCVKEQLEQYGDFSWNRMHQISPTCTTHGVWMQESKFPVIYRMDEYMKYWNQINLRQMCKCNSTESNTQARLERAQKVSKVIEVLVSGKYPKNITLAEIRETYWYKLNQKGLLYSSGESIRLTELIQQFEVYFTQELLDRMGVEVEKCITKVLNKFSNVVHPLYHVLMLVFLDIDVTTVIPKQEYTMPDIPFYCLNPLNNHEDNHIIDDIKVHYCYISKQHMCTFCCSCGFEFTTKIEDVIRSNGTKIGKIKKFGKVYEEKLLNLRHLGIKGIARKTGINHGTIRKQLRCYDKYGSIIQPVATVEAEIARLTKVRTVTQTKENQERESILKVDEEIAVTTIKKNVYTEVKWRKKDQKYYLLIQNVIDRELYSDKRPIKITKTRLAKNIGAVHAVVYNIEKMPQTKALIEHYEETQEQYYRRKIMWAIDAINERGEAVLEWKILKQVGCSDKNRELVKQLIREIIYE